jgi:hypothetical protein
MHENKLKALAEDTARKTRMMVEKKNKTPEAVNSDDKDKSVVDAPSEEDQESAENVLFGGNQKKWRKK